MYIKFPKSDQMIWIVYSLDIYVYVYDATVTIPVPARLRLLFGHFQLSMPVQLVSIEAKSAKIKTQ